MENFKSHFMKTLCCLLLSLLIGTAYAQNDARTTDTIYRSLTTIQADSLITANSSNTDFVIIDVRTPADFTNGHLQNAININYYDADFSVQIAALDHNKMYLLYCAAGSRSTATFNLMQTQNFREVYNMLGGINGWIGAGYPTTTTTDIAESDARGGLFTVYPNPVTSSTNIQLLQSNSAKIKVTNISGNCLFTPETISDTYRLDMSDWATGIYLLTIETDDYTRTKTIIKL